MVRHIPVLVEEVLTLLTPTPGQRILDGTVGSGGHAEAIIRKLQEGVYIGLDVDETSLERSRERLQKEFMSGSVTVHLIRESFRNLDRALATISIPKVDSILLDLGWSSDQFEAGGRGFSFEKDEPLDMLLSFPHREGDVQALDLINTYEEDALADLIYTYGEEQFSRRIARGIVEARARTPMTRTSELVAVIEASVPHFYKKRRIHPATKTFQALRIAVNDELHALREGLEKGREALENGGVFLVITFHSLEDRIVKHTFADFRRRGMGSVLTKKPITASPQELNDNRRARSAKLRAFRKGV